MMLTYEEFLQQVNLVDSEMSKLLYDIYKECKSEERNKAAHI